MTARRKRIQVESRQQQVALASPLRLEILEHFSHARRSSVSELAMRLDRRADSLYYHVRKLVQAGLLIESGTRKVGRRTESLYDVAAKMFEYPVYTDETSVDHILKTMRSAVRLSEREVEAGLRRGRLRIQGARRELFVARGRARLRPEALAAINRHLDAIIRICNEEFENSERHSTKGTSCSLFLALAPSPRESRRKGLRREASNSSSSRSPKTSPKTSPKKSQR